MPAKIVSINEAAKRHKEAELALMRDKYLQKGNALVNARARSSRADLLKKRLQKPLRYRLHR